MRRRRRSAGISLRSSSSNANAIKYINGADVIHPNRSSIMKRFLARFKRQVKPKAPVAQSLTIAMALLTLPLSVLMMANAVDASRLDGTDPMRRGCARDARTVASDTLAPKGKDRPSFGIIELRYSRRCGTVWARVTSTLRARCVRGDDACASAFIRRNSDGREFSCTAPNGGKSCYTRQLRLGRSMCLSVVS